MATILLTTTRSTIPDPVATLVAIQAALGNDATATITTTGVGVFYPPYTVTRASSFTSADVDACQAALDGAPALTVQRDAQNQIDDLPLVWKAIALALLDQLNVVRAALPVPLPPITVPAALAAIRNKAGTL